MSNHATINDHSIVLQNGEFKIHMSASPDRAGIWITDDDANQPIGLYADHNQLYFMVYPENSVSTIPFAISRYGLQIPDPNHMVSSLSVSFKNLYEIMSVLTKIDLDKFLKDYSSEGITDE